MTVTTTSWLSSSRPTSRRSPPTIFLGVDLGVANTAVDSDGEAHSGSALARVRMCATAATAASGKTRKHIRSKLKRIRRRESRFARDVNPVISKRLVAKAEGSDRGIALEDLKGVRNQIRFRKRQRGLMSSWSFGQLRHFVQYKASLAPVLCVSVDPRNSSRQCCICGYIAKRNRQGQASFQCGRCGHSDNADKKAALNIRAGRSSTRRWFRRNASQEQAACFIWRSLTENPLLHRVGFGQEKKGRPNWHGPGHTGKKTPTLRVLSHAGGAAGMRSVRGLSKALPLVWLKDLLVDYAGSKSAPDASGAADCGVEGTSYGHGMGCIGCRIISCTRNRGSAIMERGIPSTRTCRGTASGPLGNEHWTESPGAVGAVISVLSQSSAEVEYRLQTASG